MTDYPLFADIAPLILKLTGNPQLSRTLLQAHYSDIVAESSVLDAATLLMDNKPLSYPVFKHVEAYAPFYRSMLLDVEGDAGFVLRRMDYLAAQSYEKPRPFAPYHRR